MSGQGFGEQLASARRDAGLSVQQVSDALRIRNDIVRAIEMEDFSSMPAKAFARNQVSAYARYLGLDSGAIVRDFLDAYNDFERDAVSNISMVTNMQQPSGDRAYVEARRAQREQRDSGSNHRSSRNARKQREEELQRRRQRQREEESRYTEDNRRQRGSQRSGKVVNAGEGYDDYYSEGPGSSSGRGSASGSGRKRSGGSGSGQRSRSDGSGQKRRSGSASGQRSGNGHRKSGGGQGGGSNRSGSSRNGQRKRSGSGGGNQVNLGKSSNRRQREISQHTGSRVLNDGSESRFDSINGTTIAILVVVLVAALAIIFSVSRCSSSQSDTPDLSGSDGSSTVEVTGGSEEVESELTDEEIAAMTASPGTESDSSSDSASTASGDTFTVTVTLDEGSTAWIQIEVDDTTEVAESAEGPQEWEFEAASYAYVQTGYPSTTSVEVNGEAVELDVSSSGVGTLTITLGDDGTLTTE